MSWSFPHISSLGRAIAHRYAARGAYLYIDGRREAVETIAAECEAIHRQRGSTNRKYETQVFIGSLLDVGGPRSPGITDHTDAPCIKNVLRGELFCKSYDTD